MGAGVPIIQPLGGVRHAPIERPSKRWMGRTETDRNGSRESRGPLGPHRILGATDFGTISRDKDGCTPNSVGPMVLIGLI